MKYIKVILNFLKILELTMILNYYKKNKNYK